MAARPGEHRDPSDMGIRQQAGGAHRPAIQEGKEVVALAITAVPLLLPGDPLLLDEDHAADLGGLGPERLPATLANLHGIPLHDKQLPAGS